MAILSDTAMHNVNREQLSSLIDGELDREQAAALLRALCEDPELQRAWSDLQLVGDALRSSEVAACHAEGFGVRVRRALATEPTVLAPRAARWPLRRLMLPGAAIAASVAAIAFVAVPMLRPPAPAVTAQHAQPAEAVAAVQAELPPATDAKAAAAIANARALDPYFAAHRELTGGTALPRATAYLRTSGGER
jgi:negative regulator of sigma E activity